MKGPSGVFCGSRTRVPCLDGRRPGCRTKKASGSPRPAAPQAGEKNKARCFAGCSRLYAGVEPAPIYVEGKNADHCCACLFSAPDRNRTFKGPVLCLLSYRRMAIRMGFEPTTLWQTAGSSAAALPDHGLPRRSAGEKPNHKARLVVVSPLCHLSYGIFRCRRDSDPHPAPWNGNGHCCPCFS